MATIPFTGVSSDQPAALGWTEVSGLSVPSGAQRQGVENSSPVIGEASILAVQVTPQGDGMPGPCQGSWPGLRGLGRRGPAPSWNKSAGLGPLETCSPGEAAIWPMVRGSSPDPGGVRASISLSETTFKLVACPVPEPQRVRLAKVP